MAASLRRHWLLWVALGWLSCVAVFGLWPVSWWVELRRETVFGWEVQVDLLLEGCKETVCRAEGSRKSTSLQALRESLSLAVWTHGQCQTLEPCQYRLHTIWTIPNGLLPAKVVKVSSNVFEIHE